MGNISDCKCKCREKKNDEEVYLPTSQISQRIEENPNPEINSSTTGKNEKKDLFTLFKSNKSKNKLEKEINNKNEIEDKNIDDIPFKKTMSKVKVTIKEDNIKKKKHSNKSTKFKKNQSDFNLKKKKTEDLPRPKSSHPTRINSKLKEDLINESLALTRRKNRMILKSNHSKSQFKSFSKLSNEDFFFNKSKSKYENNNNNEDNDNENDDNSFLSEYLNIFNSTPCKNFLDRHHLYLRNSSTGLKISNIINLKLLNNNNDEILFESEIDKILFSGEKIISKKYIERYWVCTKLEVRIYTSKQKFIHLQSPIHVYKYNKMKRACFVDFDNERKSNTLDTPAFKKKHDPCNFIIYFKNESIEVFGSESEELIGKWVTIINYFIENSHE